MCLGAALVDYSFEHLQSTLAMRQTLLSGRRKHGLDIQGLVTRAKGKIIKINNTDAPTQRRRSTTASSAPTEVAFALRLSEHPVAESAGVVNVDQ